MEPITILIVDDHTLFRQTCRDMLQVNKFFRVLGCTGDAEEALEITRNCRPRITLLDINMPVDGFELARQIKQINADTKIIGFSLHTGISVPQKLMECGASGYVNKDASIWELTDAIIRVHKGEKYSSDEILNQGNRPSPGE